MTALRYFAAPAVGITLFVTGCASERHREIPASARMTVEGDGDLSYMAPHDGRVYIYDVNEDRMLHQGVVQKGAVVSVDPDEDRVTIDGNTVAEKDAFDVGHQHRIFFEEEDLPGTIAVPAGSRVKVEPQPAPDTKIEIKETEPQTRIEVQEQPDPDTRIEVQTEDQPDTHIDVDSDDANTEIKVD